MAGEAFLTFSMGISAYAFGYYLAEYQNRKKEEERQKYARQDYEYKEKHKLEQQRNDEILKMQLEQMEFKNDLKIQYKNSFTELQNTIKKFEEKQLLLILQHLAELIINDNGQNDKLYKTHRDNFVDRCDGILSMNTTSDVFKTFGEFIRKFESEISKCGKDKEFISMINGKLNIWIEKMSK